MLTAGLDSVTLNEIIAAGKGFRPLPETYLSPEYIQAHLGKLEGGATRFMTESNFSKYGIGQADGTAFVMPTEEIALLPKAAGGNLRKLEEALGVPQGFFDTNQTIKVSIPKPNQSGLRMPSENEAGANEMWLPGGKLPTGVSEAVIDTAGIKANDYTIMSMEVLK